MKEPPILYHFFQNKLFWTNIIDDRALLEPNAYISCGVFLCKNEAKA